MKKRFRTMKKWTWLLAVIALFFGVFLATAGYQMKHSIRAASYDVIDDEGNPGRRNLCFASGNRYFWFV